MLAEGFSTQPVQGMLMKTHSETGKTASAWGSDTPMGLLVQP